MRCWSTTPVIGRRRNAIDPKKLEGELGWRAEETLEIGLRKTIPRYLQNDRWWRPLRARICDGRRLGLVAKSCGPAD
jgi:dTDP-glucose 4,6-dehydratase